MPDSAANFARTKNWKFSSSDLAERALWDDYMVAYEDMLNHTSRPFAPWYAIPADSKPQMRVWVAEIIVDTLKGLNLRYPTVSPEKLADFEAYRRKLDEE